jgi:hypothetical protein
MLIWFLVTVWPTIRPLGEGEQRGNPWPDIILALVPWCVVLILVVEAFGSPEKHL